MTIRQIPIILY